MMTCHVMFKGMVNGEWYNQKAAGMFVSYIQKSMCKVQKVLK